MIDAVLIALVQQVQPATSGTDVSALVAAVAAAIISAGTYLTSARKSRVEELEKLIDNLQEERANLNARVKELEGQRERDRKRIVDLEEEREELRKRIKDLEALEHELKQAKEEIANISGSTRRRRRGLG